MQYPQSYGFQQDTGPTYRPAQYPTFEQQPNEVVYAQAGGRQGNIVTDAQPMSGMPTMPKGRDPQKFLCPTCANPEITYVRYEWGFWTFIWFVIWLFVFFPLAFLPVFVKSLKDAVHYCSNCGREVGRKKFFAGR